MSSTSSKPTILLPFDDNVREKLVSSSADIKGGSALSTNGLSKYADYDRSHNFGCNGDDSRIGRDHSARWSKLMKLYNCFNLRVLFRTLGSLIGCYPWAFVVSSLIIASLSLGMVKLRLQNRVRDGYTPSTSRSRYEMDVLKEFFGSAGDPLLTTVLLRAKDRGSMHRVDYLAEAVRLHSHLRHNITIAFRDEEDSVVGELDGRLVRYIDICGPFCDANVAVDYFYGALTDLLDSVRNGRKIYASTNLSYPIAKLNGYELHLERNFFGVKTNDLTGSVGGGGINTINKSITTDQLQELSRVTSIRHIEAIMFIFRGDISRSEDERKMTEWEMTLYKFATEHFRSPLVEMLVLGNEVVDYEMNRDARRTAPYFAMGFLFMFTFAFFSLLFSSSFYGILDWAKCALALAISLCPALAITTTFGICALIGLRTNSVMLIMPFLICGIGVNDAFLICHSWNRLAHCQLSVPDRLGLVLEETGPSVTITTLTNVVTFAIGALTPTPEISLFCLATAIALGLAYIFTVTFFTSFLYFATLVERRALAQECDPSKDNSTPLCSTVQKMLHNLCDGMATAYCELLLNRCFLVVLLTGTVVYWYFALLGTLNIHAKLDTEKILPANCPILKPHRIVSHLVWTEYYPVTVLINRPLDLRLRRDLDTFNAMVDEFEALEKCKGKQFTMLWLRDYVAYCKMVKDYGFNYFSFEDVDSSDEFDTSGERRNITAAGGGYVSETGLDFTKIDEFLSSPLYRHYRPFLKMVNTTGDSTGLVPIIKFWLTITYHNTTDWQDRIDLMQEWRRVAQKYVMLNVTVWETNGMFVDQMLSLKTLTLQTALLTLACMAIVCTIFIQNPFSVITAVLAIGSISVGVVGFLSWWHLNLDPVTLCAVLMSIGMSVDFTAHICYHFQLTKKQRIRNGGTIVEEPLRTSAEKLRNTVESVAWPMTQAGASTVICVMPLVFLQDYIPLVFVKTVFLVAIWGLFHGLVLMPAVLAALPTSLMELNCYEMLVQRVSASSSANDENGTR